MQSIRVDPLGQMFPMGCARLYSAGRHEGVLKDGPAGQVVEVGDPPVRRGVIVLDPGGFGADAHRYYLCALDSGGAVYTRWRRVAWPPEAGPPVLREALPEGAETAL